MDKRKKRYSILATIIFLLFALVSILNQFGIHFDSWIIRAVGTTVFFTPIVVLLFYIGSDERISQRVRNVAKTIGWYICVCWIAGAIATLVF